MDTIYSLAFILFSVLGWGIDSVYRSIEDKRWINAGFFRGPICPIYGFAGLVLLSILDYFSTLTLFWSIILGTLAVILVEYLGGVFTEKILHLKLWDYSLSRYHLNGHIDLLHSFYWLILVIFFSLFIYPLMQFMKLRLGIFYVVDLSVLVLLILSLFLFALNKRPNLYFQMKGKVVDMSVEKYQRLLSAFKRLSAKPLSLDKRRSLELIKKRFEQAGMFLRRKM